MFQELPKLGQPLTEEHLNFLKSFTKSARKSILEMVTNAQSGHPGGSLSCIDYLSTIYAFIISQTGEKVVVSNGHISPAVYSSLIEMGYIPKDVTEKFRKFGEIYEGHITRHVRGVEYGTGPLGVGVSVASAFAMAEKMQAATAQNSENTPRKCYALAGDGECQEGQVHEMIHFAKHHNLNNLVLFIDYNKVQLTASLEETLNIDIIKTFEAGHWNVIEIDAHNFSEIWDALGQAQNSNKPVVIIGNSIMGKGVDFMEETGRNNQADWHGKAPKPEQIEESLAKLTPTEEEAAALENFRTNYVKWQPEKAQYPAPLSLISPETGHAQQINTGSPILYGPEDLTDCRTAYGKALLDLAQNNPNVIALTADLKGSVMTKFVSEELPEQYVECGIAEQQMVSAAGGFSISGFVPFASTFGAFMSSRAKDQARVNDINYTNVKMVATHCGLSVGEDGPTHQAIDDKGSFTGFFNTMVIEPTDPNHTDHIIRYIASHYGNFYVRMGRHKFPVVLKEDGTPFYGPDYQYEYGKCDLIREAQCAPGEGLTIAASGPMVGEAIKAREAITNGGAKASKIEILAVPSMKNFTENILDSVRKTGRLLVVEDHNVYSGMGAMLLAHLQFNKIPLQKVFILGVEEYQLSGTSNELYHHTDLDAEGIAKKVDEML